MFTGEMYDATFEMKREGLRGKKLAKAMAAKFSGYSADELTRLAESVPAPELRERARIVHVALLAMLGVATASAALTLEHLYTVGNRDMPLFIACVALFWRTVTFFQAVRYRRDGGTLTIVGVVFGIIQWASHPELFTGKASFLDVLLTIGVALLAWVWLTKLFPKLTFAGKLRTV